MYVPQAVMTHSTYYMWIWGLFNLSPVAGCSYMCFHVKINEQMEEKEQQEGEKNRFVRFQPATVTAKPLALPCLVVTVPHEVIPGP